MGRRTAIAAGVAAFCLWSAAMVYVGRELGYVEGQCSTYRSFLTAFDLPANDPVNYPQVCHRMLDDA